MNRTLEVLWTIIKIVVRVAWELIVFLLGVIIAITIGSIKGAGRSKAPSGNSRD